ncbi:uncharacterized protein LOC142513097 [Primulina tabacum]|uniref:uncharacterized protein LOC142513097 n=1 Tax=Primulina tabacum TaxID=48773 RepID=UPI003F5A48DC
MILIKHISNSHFVIYIDNRWRTWRSTRRWPIHEWRYLNLQRKSSRGLGDPETTLTKFHPVCPAHVGKRPIARLWFPPEVDYRLSLLPYRKTTRWNFVTEIMNLPRVERANFRNRFEETSE